MGKCIFAGAQISPLLNCMWAANNYGGSPVLFHSTTFYRLKSKLFNFQRQSLDRVRVDNAVPEAEAAGGQVQLTTPMVTINLNYNTCKFLF